MTSLPASLRPDRVAAPADIPPIASPAIRRRFAEFGPAYRWFLLVTMLTGSMSTMLAATTINVALPAIIGAYGLGQDQAQWMSTAFLASSTLAMLANAWAMATYGPRATYVFGIATFIAGSLLGAVSTSLEMLILARAMQGLSAGLLQPMSMFLIFQTFPDRQRGTAMGLFSIGVVLAPAFGPVLGGVSVDMASWRFVFVSTVPLAIIALLMAPFLMPSGEPRAGRQTPPLDWQGLGLLSIALLGLLSAFAGGNRDGWDANITWLKIGVALAAGIAFLFWERRHPFPALNPAIFAYRQFWSAGIVVAATGVAIYGSTYLIPLFLQLVQGYSPTAAGIMMIPAGLAMMLGFPLAGRLTDRVDTRILLTFGMSCLAVSSFLMAGLTALTPYWLFVSWIVLSRIGISFCMPPGNTTAVRAVPANLLASATGGVSFLMQVGGAFGVNILAIFLQRRTIFHGEHLASGITESNAEYLYQHVLEAQELQISGLPSLPAFMQAFQSLGQDVAMEAMVLSFRDSFLLIGIWFVLILGAITLIPKPRMQMPGS
jgi:MFS transporter, DHA2 family, multidrug resistance protein